MNKKNITTIKKLAKKIDKETKVKEAT